MLGCFYHKDLTPSRVHRIIRLICVVSPDILPNPQRMMKIRIMLESNGQEHILPEQRLEKASRACGVKIVFEA